MQEPDESTRQTGSSGSRPGPYLTLEERRRIFRQMVREEIGTGLLTYSRRKLLIRYAEQIGISPFDANLLIAQAQYEAGQLEFASSDRSGGEEISFDTPISLELLVRPERWPVWFRLGIALLAAAVIDLLIIRWLL